MLTATVHDAAPGRTLRPAAASTLAPAWLHGRPGPAHVVAVFDVAVYLRRDQDVLPLLGPGALPLPGGLRVAARDDLDALGLAPGDSVTVGNGRVLGRGAGLVVRRTWRPQPVPSAALAPAARAAALAGLDGLTPVDAELAADLGGRRDGLPEEEAELTADLGGLAAAVARDLGSARPPDQGVRGLVGLGPGLTPAGDDVLCGVLLGLRATGRARDRARLERAIVPLLGRTTALSATLLRQAAGGYAVPPLVALLRAWHRGADRQRLADLGAQVAAVGHTSGPALLLGLSSALAAPPCPCPTGEPAVAPRGRTRGTS